jgi:hypothetical protein
MNDPQPEPASVDLDERLVAEPLHQEEFAQEQVRGYEGLRADLLDLFLDP